MPLKVVYLIDYMYAPGGMERMLVNKANAFVEHGLEVSIITCTPKDKPIFFALDSKVRVYDTGVDYDILKTMSGLRKAFNYKRLNNIHKKKVSEFLFQIKADVAISMHKGERRFLTSIKDGSKKMLEIHYDKGAATLGHNKFRWSNLLRIDYFLKSLFLGKSFAEVAELEMISRYDKFVVLTSEDMRQWGNLKNIDVIPNFLTVDTYHSDCRAKKIIAVGRLNVVKGYDILIDMWEKVDRGGWTIDIYGDGELRQELQDKIDKKGLSESITLYHATEEIMKRYSESSIFLLTSRSEGFPMVLLEAMASGLPSVAFACKCGPRDMILDGVSGFIIDKVGDIDSMACRVEQLMKDDDLRCRMGIAAKEQSLKFSKDIVVKKCIKLINNLKDE
ncbi:MAG: glycosyltransferase family 4 protein [Rikenellaceae bacterium]